jgi:hypothetical protein
LALLDHEVFMPSVYGDMPSFGREVQGTGAGSLTTLRFSVPPETLMLAGLST